MDQEIFRPIISVTIGKRLPTGEFTVYLPNSPFDIAYGDPNDFVGKPVKCGNRIVGKVVNVKEEGAYFVAVIECQ